MRPVFCAAIAATGVATSAMGGTYESFTTYGDLGWGTDSSSLTTVQWTSISSETGIGSAGFWTNNTVIGGSDVYTIGLKAQSYKAAMPTDGGDPSSGGNGSVDGVGSNYLYNNGAGTYYGVNGVGDQVAGWDDPSNPRQFKWGFSWAVLVNGAEVSAAEQYEIIYAFSKPGDASPSVAFELDAYDAANGGLNSASWQFGYDFFAAAGFDANAIGDYSVSISLKAFDGGGPYDISPTGVLATNSITISSLQAPAVPGVGGLAALGGLGLAGRRRRR